MVAVVGAVGAVVGTVGGGVGAGAGEDAVAGAGGGAVVGVVGSGAAVGTAAAVVAGAAAGDVVGGAAGAAEGRAAADAQEGEDGAGAEEGAGGAVSGHGSGTEEVGAAVPEAGAELEVGSAAVSSEDTAPLKSSGESAAVTHSFSVSPSNDVPASGVASAVSSRTALLSSALPQEARQMTNSRLRQTAAGTVLILLLLLLFCINICPSAALSFLPLFLSANFRTQKDAPGCLAGDIFLVHPYLILSRRRTPG